MIKINEKLKKQLDKAIEETSKQKFRCIDCNEIVIGHEGVNKHHDKNPHHYNYKIDGSNFQLGIV